MPIRVVLAEDNLLVREGVRRLLETRKDATIEVVASCALASTPRRDCMTVLLAATVRQAWVEPPQPWG
jgi:DNA-binding NarL/FixJ family response regulator